MKKRSAAFGALIVAAIVVATLLVPRYLNPPSSPERPSHDSAAWREYVAEDGSFSVAMPGKPVVSVKVGETAVAGKVSIRSAILELPKDRVTFIAYHHPIPPTVKTDDTDALLDSMAKSYVRQTRTAVIASRRIKQADAEGVAMLLFSPTTGEVNRQIVRFFVARDHAFFNIVATNDEQEGEPFVTRFLDSFRILR